MAVSAANTADRSAHKTRSMPCHAQSIPTPEQTPSTFSPRVMRKRRAQQSICLGFAAASYALGTSLANRQVSAAICRCRDYIAFSLLGTMRLRAAADYGMIPATQFCSPFELGKKKSKVNGGCREISNQVAGDLFPSFSSHATARWCFVFCRVPSSIACRRPALVGSPSSFTTAFSVETFERAFRCHFCPPRSRSRWVLADLVILLMSSYRFRCSLRFQIMLTV